MLRDYRFAVVVDCTWNREYYPGLVGTVYAVGLSPSYCRVAIINRHCWTGGDSAPAGYGRAIDFKGRLRFAKLPGLIRGRAALVTERVFAGVRSLLFREYVSECGGLDLWECAETSRWERARLFWNRANLDAWRTLERWE